MAERIGKRTVEFKNVYVHSYAAVVGKKEGEGPMKDWFDKIYTDEYMNSKSFEQAESKFQKQVLETALKKGNMSVTELDYVLAGDLLNQCIGSSFGIRDMGVPFLGLYGACSTMALSMGLASILVDSGAAKKAAAMTSSHFCSSERQFRFPLEYGCQRTPTSQWTVTGAGAAILTSDKTDVKVTRYIAGEIVDLGIKDANNMGAAMAPAAYETISEFLSDTKTKPSDYDCIFTGDLGFVGSQILYELMKRDGIDLKPYHNDCGMMMFNREEQDVHAGGSGCGCVASITCGYILPNLKAGKLKKVLVCGTGALLSTVSTQQGESIPCIAHCVQIESTTADSK